MFKGYFCLLARPNFRRDPARGVLGLSEHRRGFDFPLTKRHLLQGTGIVNTLLFDLPWEAAHPAFRAIGAAFLIFDIVLFLAFTLISITRYALYPRIFLVMLRHETHSLFLGTIPMGFVTIISGIARTGTEYGIEKALDASLVMWWVALGKPAFLIRLQTWRLTLVLSTLSDERDDSVRRSL